MNLKYARQAELVIKVIPHVATEETFALKGGTAINLFEQDLPRLSVDIDLTYTVISDRQTAICEINAALDRISKRLKRFGVENRLSGTEVSRKILCVTPDAAIKIEPNFILRGTVFPTRKLSSSPKTQSAFGQAKIGVLSQAELYGGKVCAALDRQHPRDLFDVAQFYKIHELEEIKPGFIALALGHNRPLHELLNPILQDHREVFEQQFAGMTDVPFSYEEHVKVWKRMQVEVLSMLTESDRRNMLAFVSLAGSPDQFGIPNLSRLPAIVWKQKNLASLKVKDPAKFAQQHDRLQALLQM